MLGNFAVYYLCFIISINIYEQEDKCTSIYNLEEKNDNQELFKESSVGNINNS